PAVWRRSARLHPLRLCCCGLGWRATNMIGSDFINTIPGMCSDNLEENIQGVRRCLRVLFEKQPAQEEFEVLVACSMVVPATARLGMLSRTIDRDTVMQGLRVPVLVMRGEKDAIATLAHTQHLLTCIPHAKASLFEGIGHSPHLEDAERFNLELT